MRVRRLVSKLIPGKDFSLYCRRIEHVARDKVALLPIAAQFQIKNREICFKRMTRLAILGAM
jgi:hypothetical protein